MLGVQDHSLPGRDKQKGGPSTERSPFCLFHAERHMPKTIGGGGVNPLMPTRGQSHFLSNLVLGSVR
jgi:hypothetical protein